MSTRLSIREDGLITEIPVSEGETLLEALRAAGDSGVDAPCGGKGLCGKCRVRASGALAAPLPSERASLSAAELSYGWRLACQARVEGDAHIERTAAAVATILAEGPSIPFLPDPPVRRMRVFLPPTSLEEQLSDEDRLLAAIASALRSEKASGAPARPAPRRVSFSALPGLAVAARGERVDVILRDGEVLEIEAAREAALEKRFSLGLGADIGTTTVVCYLVDLETGALLGVRSALNSQRAYGADVISRIAATMESAEGLGEQRARVADQLSSMALSLVASVGARPEDLLSVAIAGNTTMLHLLSGVPPAAIAVAPFPSVFTARRSVGALELALDLPRNCTVFLLPGVSGYVGADIVSGIAALGMAERDETALFLDIGTNGEIALGGSSGILCCATAAGPAFEGAGISMGMGGVEGAIDSVWLEGGALGYSTIGGGPPLGFCGSGVLDALAVFLDAGLVDDTGRVVDAEEAATLPPWLAALRSQSGGDTEANRDSEGGAGIGAEREAGPAGGARAGPRLEVCGGVFLSQGDVRQLQLAVAAIAAGIDVLLARAGKTTAAIDRVFLAGGFGSRLDVKSALRVGLLPRELEDRVVVAGNTSGAGAVGACLSRSRLAACDTVRSLCRYVELSSQTDFAEAFVERMMFPVAR